MHDNDLEVIDPATCRRSIDIGNWMSPTVWTALPYNIHRFWGIFRESTLMPLSPYLCRYPWMSKSANHHTSSMGTHMGKLDSYQLQRGLQRHFCYLPDMRDVGKYFGEDRGPSAKVQPRGGPPPCHGSSRPTLGLRAGTYFDCAIQCRKGFSGHGGRGKLEDDLYA